jgi:hypothetical protein
MGPLLPCPSLPRALPYHASLISPGRGCITHRGGARGIVRDGAEEVGVEPAVMERRRRKEEHDCAGMRECACVHVYVYVEWSGPSSPIGPFPRITHLSISQAVVGSITNQ